MSRLTVNLPDELHKALKAAAARQGVSVTHLVEESLAAYGIKPEGDVISLVEAARARSGLSDDQALELAVSETREVRGE